MTQTIENEPLQIEGMIPSALIGGGLSLAGSLASNFFNAKQQSKANDENRRLAMENRAWQEKMANTAHQREVADLRAAGLNPILSAGGSGASTPNSAPATVNPMKIDENMGNNAYKNYLNKEELQQSLVRSKQEVNNMRASELTEFAKARNIEADTAKKMDDVITNSVLRPLYEAQTSASRTSAKKMGQDMLESGSRIKSQQQDRRIRGYGEAQQSQESQIYKDYGHILTPFNIGAESVGKVFSTINNAKQLLSPIPGGKKK